MFQKTRILYYVINMPLSNDEALQKTPQKTSEQDSHQSAAQAGLKWGKSPKIDEQPSDIPDDHPVHNIPLKEQEKMRQKGVNPVLKAEMDEAMGKGQPGGKFWKRYGTTSMGPWMV
ncbi:hypothetical protein TGAM01_v209034 [Trichoderma gamsii]|uniref:Uncharacterized protein n=1 Tax=Trichoderma gamsii TaxID=398673 RepID=A0A2P4ZD05_9HYPO|nr:hypothetical protein TGAM01_v209034 [Trichoderma gamsii]PON22160.1 hypothetical protein TGAM01_v209034 [Trichoderma gamsii]